ncbi:hypothetical protein [Duganella sp. Dugasp56]|uniref:hypothetical protein n=1 Tax=Duganella sp. Dugasp56 TaxID=3243046 RepID=UPI0039AEF949
MLIWLHIINALRCAFTMSAFRFSIRSIIIAAMIAALAACGGGGGGAPSAPAPPAPPPPTLAGISLLAGSIGGAGNIDGTGTAARLASQFSVAAGVDGTFYIAERSNYAIRKVTPAGAVTIFAGNGKFVTLDGIGTGAGFSDPEALTVDGAGNVYVVDGSAIRKITPAGAVTTLAGKASSYGTNDGAGADAGFHRPQGIAVDDAGNIYVADTGNASVRKITPGGVVTTVAGKAGETAITDGPVQSARFNGPNGITIDGAGNIYVVEFDGVFYYVRKVSAAGTVSTLAKIATGYTIPLIDPGSVGLSADRAGNVFLADGLDNTVRKIAADGSITILAGAAGMAGYVDAAGSDARFQQLWGITADRSGNVYAGDSSALRKITPAGMVTTLAGAMEQSGAANGAGAGARFGNLTGIASDAAGNVIVTQGTLDGHTVPMHAIRMISPAGVVTNLAGSADKSGSTDGNATDALFNNPTGMAVDSDRNIYVADNGNHTIRKIAANGTVTTLAGSAGKAGSDDGAGAAARFSSPAHLAVDSANNIYVADVGSRTLRKITPAGIVTTLALSYAANDVPLSGIAGIAVDRSGNLYVSDTREMYLGSSSTIRKITPAGNVTTLAGTYQVNGDADGNGAAASFRSAAGIAVATDGNVYVADKNNSLIRRITPDGVVTTVAGQRGTLGISLGSLPGSLYFPGNISAGPNGELYVTSEYAVLKLRF